MRNAETGISLKFLASSFNKHKEAVLESSTISLKLVCKTTKTAKDRLKDLQNVKRFPAEVAEIPTIPFIYGEFRKGIQER